MSQRGNLSLAELDHLIARLRDFGDGYYGTSMRRLLAMRGLPSTMAELLALRESRQREEQSGSLEQPSCEE